ncbi:MAG TPA: hypothetical protein ENI75_01815 [Mizugakiibacter sp.]|nr:hypothetical protein [Mizugakiibacter sp.]
MMGFGNHVAGFFGGWSIVGMTLMVVFWGAIIALLVVVLRRRLDPERRSQSEQTTERPPPSPLEILQTRLARGEIDSEEFEECRRMLKKKS